MEIADALASEVGNDQLAFTPARSAPVRMIIATPRPFAARRLGAVRPWLRCVARASIVCMALALGCGDDDSSPPSMPADPAGTGGSGGETAAVGGRAGSAGASGARSSSPLSCPAHDTAPVTCGGVMCSSEIPPTTNPCFVPCCVMFEGRERCGLRGTAAAFRTECVLAAEPDDSCDEIVQFQGCCDLTQHRCGIIGGFAPGCTTKSSFVTLPQNPKRCGMGMGRDDAGVSDGG
jgi:hypothetical protein